MTTDISVVRGGWDPTLQQEIVDEYEYDGGNSSSRLFERSRIKALAGTKLCQFSFPIALFIYISLQLFFVFCNYSFIKTIARFVFIDFIRNTLKLGFVTLFCNNSEWRYWDTELLLKNYSWDYQTTTSF